MYKLRAQQGFTLIELMTVVVIVGILAGIAFPGYLSQLQKARRAEAVITLEQLAQRQELFFGSFRTYTAVVAGPSACADAACGLNQSSTTSVGGHYNITAAGNGTSYTLTATAAGIQLDDTDCRTFVLSNSGVRTAADSGGGDRTDTCW
jgi:type IV pilus assembly protein PilE